jgi:AMP-binding enzyme
MSTHQDSPDYPVPDYVPMAATALTDAQRWPLLTDAGAANLRRLREHPNAPHYNHACGDRLTETARTRLRDYRTELAAGSGWRADADPSWLTELIDRVYRTVPRYRTRRRPERLAEVPTTDRHDLLGHVEQHVPDDADLDDLIVFRTSGSRGPAATVPMTPEFCALDLPVIEHVLTGLGVRLSGGADRVSLVNVYHQPRAYQFASVSSYLDGAGVVKINLDASGWRDPADRTTFLDDCAAEVYTGNPISLAALADLDLRTAPKAILSGAMALGDGLRERLRTRFGCPVVDLYGITEAGLIAWRHEGGEHRLLPRRLLVEILDADGNRCPDGVSGEITITCGENAALPLLRYRTGDHAALGWRDGAPVLVGFEGREPVRFRAAAGTWVQSIELTHVLSPLGFAAWRLHQDADGAVSLTLHDAGAPDEAAARDAVRGLLGDLPIAVTTADLAGDAKPQRYSCAVAGAAIG